MVWLSTFRKWNCSRTNKFEKNSFRLSGTFPFNEDEEIEDVRFYQWISYDSSIVFVFSKFAMQILCFLSILGRRFPVTVDWISFSSSFLRNNNPNLDFLALSFVQTLLELDSRKRLLINKVFLQPWLQVDTSDLLFSSSLGFIFHLHENKLFFGKFVFAWVCGILLATDLISHHLLQVNAGYRLAAANARRHAYFEVWARFLLRFFSVWRQISFEKSLLFWCRIINYILIYVNWKIHVLVSVG